MKKVVFAICCVIASYSDVFSTNTPFGRDIMTIESEMDVLHSLARIIVSEPDSDFQERDMYYLVKGMEQYIRNIFGKLEEFCEFDIKKIADMKVDELIQQEREALKVLSKAEAE